MALLGPGVMRAFARWAKSQPGRLPKLAEAPNTKLELNIKPNPDPNGTGRLPVLEAASTRIGNHFLIQPLSTSRRGSFKG